MVLRKSTPFSLHVLFLLLMLVFLLSLVSICLLTVSTSIKVLLAMSAASYFLKIVYEKIIIPQPFVTQLNEEEFKITVGADAFFACLQPDSLIARWFMLLRFREKGGKRAWVVLLSPLHE